MNKANNCANSNILTYVLNSIFSKDTYLIL